jgi:hypothetical protein
VVVDAARLLTAVAGPPQEALKPPIADRVAGAVARPGSHRTVRALVAHGSSGRRVMNPAAGRLSTSISFPQHQLGLDGSDDPLVSAVVHVDHQQEPAVGEEPGPESLVDGVAVAQRPP